jgi:hypothetical protein
MHAKHNVTVAAGASELQPDRTHVRGSSPCQLRLLLP